MNIFGAIFGSKKNTENIVSGALGGIDKLFFTKEERAEASAKSGEFFLRYLEASKPQNIARRFIAVIVVLLWALLIVFGIVIRWASYEMSDFVFKVLNDLVHQPLMLIMGFYFLAHVVRNFKKGS